MVSRLSWRREDKVKLERDDNENNLENIENNLENQDVQILIEDEERILKTENNNPCNSSEVKAECESFACDQCGYFTYREAHLGCHKKYKKHDVGSLMCEVCGSTFTHLKTLRKLKERFHDETNFKCSDCDYSGKTKSILKTHMTDKHSDEKRFTCDYCVFATKRKACLADHARRKHPS